MAEVAPFPIPPVVKRVTVGLDQDRAFARFTDGLGSWWPLHSHSRSGKATSCAFEPRLGGRLFERTEDGEELVWGNVEVWEPPARVGFTWRVGNVPEGQHIEVTFTPAGAGRTEVVLTHTGWESLGDEAARVRERYENGWEAVFIRGFAGVAAG
ncbi:SRPBCC domain-containing protein [Phenylobacterium terrae]|uniref:SRPBCC domain-containing protein n=1 Tax=Phenylobacterium terrae TaxID=2665495 RepID=A0ABW4N3Z5_9CAUL